MKKQPTFHFCGKRIILVTVYQGDQPYLMTMEEYRGLKRGVQGGK